MHECYLQHIIQEPKISATFGTKLLTVRLFLSGAAGVGKSMVINVPVSYTHLDVYKRQGEKLFIKYKHVLKKI